MILLPHGVILQAVSTGVFFIILLLSNPDNPGNLWIMTSF